MLSLDGVLSFKNDFKGCLKKITNRIRKKNMTDIELTIEENIEAIQQENLYLVILNFIGDDVIAISLSIGQKKWKKSILIT